MSISKTERDKLDQHKSRARAQRFGAFALAAMKRGQAKRKAAKNAR